MCVMCVCVVLKNTWFLFLCFKLKVLQPRKKLGQSSCLAWLGVVNLPDRFVKGSALLNGHEASQSHFLTDLLDGLCPSSQSVFLHQASAFCCELFGNYFPALALNKVLLCQTADSPLACSVPYLPLFTDDRCSLGFFGLSRFTHNLTAGNPALGRGVARPSHRFTSDGHFRIWRMRCKESGGKLRLSKNNQTCI